MNSSDLMKTIIDLNTWDRQEPYYIFKTFEIPYTNLCTEIDITNFMTFIRKNNYHFYSSLLFYITKAANIIKEFRCRLEEDTPIIWNRIGANYTLMQNSGIVGNNYTDFVDDFNIFYPNVMEDLESAKKSGHMINKSHNSTVITITSIPWTNLTNFSQAIYKVNEAVPYLGIGRRYGLNDRVKISIAVQAHHAFIDGFHISHYFKLLELLLSDPLKYSNSSVPYEELLAQSKPFILSEQEKPFYTY